MKNYLLGISSTCSQIVFLDKQHNALFITTDGGQSFSYVNPGFKVEDMKAHPTNPNIISAHTETADDTADVRMLCLTLASTPAPPPPPCPPAPTVEQHFG